MVCEGIDDPEGEIWERLRQIQGMSDIPIGGVLDLHGNITSKIQLTNAFVTYRENPHRDGKQAAGDGARILNRLMNEQLSSTTVYRLTNIIWPPTGTGTDDEPMKSLESMARKMEADNPEVLSVNIHAGFSFADISETGVSFYASTAGDPVYAQGLLAELANYAELRDQLLTQTDYHLTRNTDTEIIMHYLSHELSKAGDERPDLFEVFRNLALKFDGAYNLVFLNARGDMVVLRDPNGFRPLCYAQDGPLFAAASESVALLNLGFDKVVSLEPGEMILIEDGDIRKERFAPVQTPSHCFFEWIYFANVASTLDGRGVYTARSALGRQLAQFERHMGKVPLDEGTIVVPVPDTGKAAADAMAYELGLPSMEGLIRNRYIGRTFIEGQNRAERVQLKYTPLREVLEGKRVLLIEDTIVRSTTMKALLTDLRRRGGAKEIHVRVACPPIVAPCFYGIDMSTVRELFAPRFIKGGRITEEEQEAMAAELGADSLAYLPVEAIAASINLDPTQLCRGCLTGKYPTPTGEKLYQLSLRQRNTPASNGRTYELTGSITPA